ncbi:hypothetical protein BGX20_007364 [Mortierella sp. AD010]|nr:hypothetical protein BGX20_007364 [Mortierella sp. AD010]
MTASSSNDKPTCNILFLGETQSGKSTLIEGFKRYADPDYQINKNVIGDGVFSRTQNVLTSFISTSRPTYYVTETTYIDGEERKSPVDYGLFIENMDKEDYEDAINRRKGYELTKGESASGQEERKFRLIDTPGLNDTNNFDETHIGSIFKALEGMQNIHLVLITVSNGALSEGVKNAIRCYVNMLPDFKGIIAFVHTKIGYKHLHPGDEQFARPMEEKKRTLDSIILGNPNPDDECFASSNVTHFKIDCDLRYARPVLACITQNTIRSMLSLAAFNQPIRVTAMTMVKTTKMLEVDRFLEDKYKEVIEARNKFLGHKSQEQCDVLATIARRKASIGEKEHQLGYSRGKLSAFDNDELVSICEDRFDQDWSPWKKTGIRRMSLKSPLRVDHHDVLIHNVVTSNESGGKGKFYWSADYRRKRFQHGVLHVKLYVKKKNKNQALIEEWRWNINNLPSEIEDLKKELQEYESKEQQHRDEIQKLLEELDENQYLLDRVRGNELDIEIFHELVEFGAYMGTRSEYLAKVEKFYLKNRHRFEEREEYTQQQPPSEPVNNSIISVDNGGKDPEKAMSAGDDGGGDVC